jgi:hypothetical protein
MSSSAQKKTRRRTGGLRVCFVVLKAVVVYAQRDRTVLGRA